MDVRYHLAQVIDAEIIVENEANAYAFAETLFKINSVADPSFAYLTINDDVGTGVVFEQEGDDAERFQRI